MERPHPNDLKGIQKFLGSHEKIVIDKDGGRDRFSLCRLDRHTWGLR
jgi:hypothetical protein